MSFNSEARIKNLEEDCGLGIIEGLCQGKIAVRFNPNLFTKKGIQYMRGNTALNPSGKLSIVFLVPEPDLVIAGTFKTEKSNGARGTASSKAKRKAQ